MKQQKRLIIRGDNPQAVTHFRKDYVGSKLKEIGFGGTPEEWEYCRKIVVDPIDHDGKFLDVGCANGVLVGDVMNWASEKKVHIDGYRIDFIPEFIEKAKKRLPQIAAHFQVADANIFNPKFAFDYIRTELWYFPKGVDRMRAQLLRYMRMLNHGGKLLITVYDDDKPGKFKKFIKYISKLELGKVDVYANKATCVASITNTNERF